MQVDENNEKFVNSYRHIIRKILLLSWGLTFPSPSCLPQLHYAAGCYWFKILHNTSVYFWGLLLVVPGVILCLCNGWLVSFVCFRDKWHTQRRNNFLPPSPYCSGQIFWVLGKMWETKILVLTGFFFSLKSICL